MSLGLVLALLAVFGIGAAVFVYERYFKNHKRVKPLLSIEKKPQQQSTGHKPIKLDVLQVRRLFDQLLRADYAMLPVDFVRVGIVFSIGGVGAWYIRTGVNTIERYGGGTFDARVDLRDIDVFNELINRDDFSEGYLLGLKFRGAIDVQGSLRYLEELRPLLGLLQFRRKTYLAELEVAEAV